ncbi:hypothetical protein NFI96_006997 [Prochilodus magdalenae]|nr:hypothetical protein NFI96_006997 [Prochilodus magdalenae]
MDSSFRAKLGRLQLLRTPAWRWRAQRTKGKRKRCERRHKRGKRSGALIRLKANTDRPPIPSLFLSNVRSLDNKLDLLQLRMSVSEEMRNCAVICLTETWTYHPTLRRSRPTQKTITVWPRDADAVLKDCFGCSDWQVFREAAESEGELDLEDYTSAVLGYISKCVEDVTTLKTVTCYPNQKLWLNGEAAVPTCLKTATVISVPKSSTVTDLNNYRPIALTPIVTKCFERLVMIHIKATIDVTVDPHQYAYRRDRSTDDAISSVVHTALTHLEQRDSYVRMLFVDFTSAFNTMIPQTLTDKLSSLGLRSSLCNWVLDFLTNRPQSVGTHNLTSSTTILSTGSPQGCVLSPLLFTLLTYDCSPIHPGCHIVKFADDTAVVGCITNSDESGYRQEVEHLEGWCRKNNPCINVKKTKEMIVDFRRGRHAHLPLHVGGSAVEVVSSYRYLGVHLSNNLTWSNNTSSLVRKAHQRLYFLRRLRRAGLGSSVLTSFYRCVVESVLCSSINVWHRSCSAADRKALQRVVKAAQRPVTLSEVYRPNGQWKKSQGLHMDAPSWVQFLHHSYLNSVDLLPSLKFIGPPIERSLFMDTQLGSVLNIKHSLR